MNKESDRIGRSEIDKSGSGRRALHHLCSRRVRRVCGEHRMRSAAARGVPPRIGLRHRRGHQGHPRHETAAGWAPVPGRSEVSPVQKQANQSPNNQQNHQHNSRHSTLLRHFCHLSAQHWGRTQIGNENERSGRAGSVMVKLSVCLLRYTLRSYHTSPQPQRALPRGPQLWLRGTDESEQSGERAKQKQRGEGERDIGVVERKER
jgi:hypothetical protein